MEYFGQLEQIDALCVKIERLRRRLAAQEIGFQEAYLLWDHDYQPAAERLAKAMLEYLPNGDPRLVVKYARRGFGRVASSDIISNIRLGFTEDFAPTLLKWVPEILRTLLAYVPAEILAPRT
jgi:hypothetical protein